MSCGSMPNRSSPICSERARLPSSWRSVAAYQSASISITSTSVMPAMPAS
jgi:hypothetical protein